MDGKVLIVDDNKDIISFLKPALETEGYTVDFATNGSDALEKIHADLTLILLDVMLPDMNGFDICRQIRQHVSCPILFLTARGLEQERVNGFLVGGDDYIVKPFSLQELILRVNVHVKKDPRWIQKKEHPTLQFSNLIVDMLAKSIRINGEIVDFTKKEYKIIELLSTHPSQVFSKEQIFEEVWGYMSESDINTITEHIRRIRAKLQLHGCNHNYIKTVWGIGYKWEY
ncbi:response regulator transcription factor [Bacillus gaemokensis]|uniref:Chemotaxis protein CheY n=1 Tax=Bacillus gaemokensis TaxID=574375 RepID=A0A073KCL9_9BACI|nr:response regulator transcription factor [Bacillus gaemokensis]KEK24984.1 chemotaxis protein CheY [Bacillus gaemokensis]KYG32625.1 two-component system response regulator [Bacillus gaemokensis]